MKDQTMHSDSLQQQNQRFFNKAEKGFRNLFDLARSNNELHFAFSLSAEFRGEQAPGWNTAADAHAAFNEYLEFLEKTPNTPLKVRVALAFYCHLAEASGFYEIPKNMLRVAEGKPYHMWPFLELVEKHKSTGAIIAPNANKVLKDLAGHARTLGLDQLAEVFRDAFDPQLRNSYAHADYVIWEDGIRLRMRNGGNPRKIPWPEFNARLDRGMNFFLLLYQVVGEYMDSYHPPKQIRARLSAGEPEGLWTIHSDPANKSFSISGGICQADPSGVPRLL